jgi:hypothetical protein
MGCWATVVVDVLGIPIANRVGAANISDPVAGSRLLAGLPQLWPTIRTIIADAGHEGDRACLSGRAQCNLTLT